MVDFNKQLKEFRNRMATKKTAAVKTTTPSPEEGKMEATVKQTALATRTRAESLMEENAGAGMETMGTKDLAIPRISILQSNSPQVKKSEGAYIKGAAEGDFYDNVANGILSKGEEGFLFIPVSYRRANIEWIPRKAGGGFVADHGNNDQVLTKCTKDPDTNAMMLANGHEIVTCAEYFCICLDKDGKHPHHAVISLTKTQLKKAKKLNTQLSTLALPSKKLPGTTYRPPMFASVFAATSIPESNDKGSWMGWNITRSGLTVDLEGGSELVMAADQFRQAVAEGTVKVAAPVEPGIGQTTEADDAAF